MKQDKIKQNKAEAYTYSKIVSAQSLNKRCSQQHCVLERVPQHSRLPQFEDHEAPET